MIDGNFSLTPALSRPPSLRYGATEASLVEAEGEVGRWERENRSQFLEKCGDGICWMINEKLKRTIAVPSPSGRGSG